MSLENILDGLSSEEARERIIAIAVKKGLTIIDEHVEIAKKYLRDERLFAKIALEKGNYKEAIEGFSEIGMYKESADILVKHIGDIQKAIDLLAKETRYQHVAWDRDGWERARQSLCYAIELAKQHNLPEKEQEVYEKFASGLIENMGMTREYDLDSYCSESGFRFFRNLNDEEIKTNLGKKIIELDLKKTKGYVAGQMCEVLDNKEEAIRHYLNFFKEVLKKDSTYEERERAHNARKKAEKFIEDLPEPKKIEFLEGFILDYEEQGNLGQAADICVKLGRYEQAIRYLESIHCDAQQVAELYGKIGKSERAKGIYKDLAKWFLNRKPGDAGACFAGTRAAEFALKAGDIDLAITGHLKGEQYIEAVKLCLEHGKTVRARKIYRKGIIYYEERLHIELAKNLADILGDQKKIKLYHTISEGMGKVEPSSLY